MESKDSAENPDHQPKMMKRKSTKKKTSSAADGGADIGDNDNYGEENWDYGNEGDDGEDWGYGDEEAES